MHRKYISPSLIVTADTLGKKQELELFLMMNIDLSSGTLHYFALLKRQEYFGFWVLV